MASKVFLHIGLPKTATTYLQTIMWAARDQMHVDGVLLPGAERRDHLWATRIIREEPRLDQRPERQQTAWERLVAEIQAWPGPAVVTHEFFAAASAEQAARAIAALAPAEVHLVVTAREPLGLLAASWQESLKNRQTRPLDGYPGGESENPMAIWNWRSLDLRLVLERWAPGLPPEHVHVLPLPAPGAKAPRDLVWKRFATLVGLDPDAYDHTVAFANSSMGLAEAETLRRVNEHLEARELLVSSVARGTMIRTYLADERLVPRGGDRFWPEPAEIADARERGRAQVEHVRAHGYDVIGELDALLVPDELAERRTIASVTDAEVADIATDLVGQVLSDLHESRREVARLQRRLARALEPMPPPPPPPTLTQRVRGKVARMVRGSR